MYLRFFLLSFLLLVACKKVDVKVETQESAPKVFFAIGNVTVNGQTAKIGQKINDGDIFETGSESFLEAKFNTQSAFRVREESRVIFNTGDGITLTVEKGKVLNILEEDRHFQVRTPSAVAAVRGTIFFVSVINDNKTYFCACNGTVAIEDDHNKELTSLSSAHHMPNFCDRDGEKLSMESADMMDHDDLEIFGLMYRMDKAVVK